MNSRFFISVNATPNPNCLQFFPHKKVSSHVVDFPTARDAQKNTLAKRLFELEGVKGVLYGDDFITVTKDKDLDWEGLDDREFSSILCFIPKIHAYAPTLSQAACAHHVELRTYTL
jgi:hypothetical protein